MQAKLATRKDGGKGALGTGGRHFRFAPLRGAPTLLQNAGLRSVVPAFFEAEALLSCFVDIITKQTIAFDFQSFKSR